MAKKILGNSETRTTEVQNYVYLGESFFKEQNFEEAFNWFMKAAKQENAIAQNWVAYLYFSGKGVEENKKEAFKWGMKSAEHGNAEAQCYIASCYKNGYGIKENNEKAFEWYMKAAKQGYAQAQYGLAELYLFKNLKEEAFEWYMKAAKQGYAKAQEIVGCFYENGCVVEKNKKEASKWYTEAEKGYVVEKNDKWYAEAALQNNDEDLKGARMTDTYGFGGGKAGLVEKGESSKMKTEKRKKNCKKVFIIHGHNEAKLRELKEILEKNFNLEPIILSEQAGEGKTLIEKIEKYASECSYAFAIFTPDDIVSNNGEKYFQVRPNVIFELGWFYAKLGRSKVCILNQGSKQDSIFSDLKGVEYVSFKDNISEKYLKIKTELEAGEIL